MPSEEAAFKEAADILDTLGPSTSTDTETLGLYGAIYKRLWELRKDTADLDQSIWAYEKGFYVKNDYYNGINLAYLLNVRADLNIQQPSEAIADFVLARRVRERVLALCKALITAKPALTGAESYWIRASMAEAYCGLGDEAKVLELMDTARTLPEAHAWMIGSTEAQLGKLKILLARFPFGTLTSGAVA